MIKINKKLNTEERCFFRKTFMDIEKYLKFSDSGVVKNEITKSIEKCHKILNNKNKI